jgi:predicted DNA-binding transcriptional regulator YafY
MTQLEMTNAEDDSTSLDQAPSVRFDALPENVRYRDEGCDLSPSCLNCRLPVCRYDHPAGTRRLRTLGRDEEIVRLRRRDRLPIDILARRFHVSRRTVFRILRRCPLAKSDVGQNLVGEDFSPPAFPSPVALHNKGASQ